LQKKEKKQKARGSGPEESIRGEGPFIGGFSRRLLPQGISAPLLNGKGHRSDRKKKERRRNWQRAKNTEDFDRG